MRTLLSDLRAARREASAAGFDLPSEAAYLVAEDVLRKLARSAEWSEGVESAVAVDGSIEVTSLSGIRYLVVDVAPTGSRIDVVIQDLETGDIVLQAAARSAAEAVLQIERPC